MKAGAEEAGEAPQDDAPKTAVNRGISRLDFIMRIVAVIGTFGSAVAMGTTSESFPLFTQFIRFRAKYNDLPTFTFFVVANVIVTAYLILSLLLSIFHIVKSDARVTRTVLIIFDMAMLAFLTSGASAATAIVYLAHKGNTRANWFAICQQFNSFCERVSGSLVGSFIAILVLMLLIVLSAVALSRN
ncbi:casparian strip membrane protein 1-like [Olea europaea var. sylvestris]|uniref:CASP-like protein n=1 Tax=Olea europaea subsp. europaea TaxID=158383 RepID=A0A8S0T988_OLEEU|nr:casparian strip membrane protein 1-like [Olea europaea var. sylvestris]CAA3001578.1 casparian strip membrane 3-like [Olea europaea subsp. europaea]